MSPLSPWLTRRRFAALLGLVFVCSGLKACRMPNLWTATHFTFNYSQGFIRRGLVGEIARLLTGSDTYHYNRFVGFAFAILALILVVWFVLIRRLLRAYPDDPLLRGALWVFAASPGFVMLVHTVGYLDQLGMLALSLFILLAVRARGELGLLAGFLVLGAIFVFIHECLGVMFAPMMLFVVTCHVLNRRSAGQLSARGELAFATSALVVCAIVFGLAGVVGTAGTKPPAQIEALRTTLSAQVDFVLRVDAFETLHRSARENLLTLMPGYYTRPIARTLMIRGALIVLPCLTFLVGYGLLLIHRAEVHVRGRWWLGALFVGATLSPLTLHLVGWDHGRWNAIAVVVCFLGVASARLLLTPDARMADGSLEPLSGHLLFVGAIAIVLGLVGDQVLFDGAKVHLYPYDQDFVFFFDLLGGDGSFRPGN